MVLQSHFRMHGEEYYEEAKSVRAVVEQTLLMTGQMRSQNVPDPVRDLALARQLIAGSKPKAKTSLKTTFKCAVSLELKLA